LNHELKVCNSLISSLKCSIDDPNAKIEKLNACHASTSSIEHVSICTRCRDFDVDDFVGHVAMIKSLNEHVAKLEAKITEHELENEKYKFVRSILFNERRPRIKDVVGFQTGEKDNTKVKVNEQEFLKFVKGKAPIVHHDHAHVS
jgi:hypothetical protein